jgi:hypothetical protein
MTDRERSPAFVVLPKTARRMLGVIEKAAGGGSVEMSYASLMHDHRFGRPSVSASVKALVALGWIDVEAGPRLVNRYRLSRRWATIDAGEAARLVREARKVMPQRRHEKRRVPVEPQPAPETQCFGTPLCRRRITMRGWLSSGSARPTTMKSRRWRHFVLI